MCEFPFYPSLRCTVITASQIHSHSIWSLWMESTLASIGWKISRTSFSNVVILTLSKSIVFVGFLIRATLCLPINALKIPENEVDWHISERTCECVRRKIQFFIRLNRMRCVHPAYARPCAWECVCSWMHVCHSAMLGLRNVCFWVGELWAWHAGHSAQAKRSSARENRKAEYRWQKKNGRAAEMPRNLKIKRTQLLNERD